MGTVGTGFSMSLDGFVAGKNDDVSKVFAWMSQGDTDMTLQTGDGDLDLKVSKQSADMLTDASRSVGALVAGRHLFDIANAWGGKHPLNVPVVVVTHHVPEEWANKPGSPFTFVTDGVASAIQTAQQIAGDKMIAIASPSVLQQAIKLGLLDEIHIDLVPVLLGGGVSMFDQLGIDPLDLECTNMIKAPGVIHLDFRVIK